MMSAVPSVVSSATAAGESIVSQISATGCSIGTRYGCVSLADHSSCSLLPLVGSNLFAALLLTDPSLATLQNLLERVPTLTTFLVVGVAATLVSFVSFALQFLIPFMSYIVCGFSVLALVFLGTFAAFTITIFIVASRVGTLAEAQVESGSAFIGSLVNLSCSIALAAVSLKQAIL